MTTSADIIYQRRVRLLELAEELGNVSAACPDAHDGGPRDDRAMNHPVAVPHIAPPAARYVHAVVSESPSRTLHTAGVVPVDADGNVPPTLADQARLVWSNLRAILSAAAMEVSDVVSVTTYVVAGEDLGVVMAARDDALAGHLAASTLVTVPVLAQPAWRVEVALVAMAD